MFCTCRAHFFAGRLVIRERAVHVIVSIVDGIPACYAITMRRVWIQDSIDRLAPVSCAFLFHHHNVCTPLVRCLLSQFFLLLLPATVLMVQDFKDDNHDASSNSGSNHYKHTWKIRNKKGSCCQLYLNTFFICTSSIKHFVYPLEKKKSVTLVFNFSFVLKSSQEKLKRMLMENFRSQTRCIIEDAKIGEYNLKFVSGIYDLKSPWNMPCNSDACSRLRDRRVRGDWESANRKVASLPLSESLEQAMIAWVRGCRLGWRPSLRTAIVKFSVYFAVCYCDLYIQWNLEGTDKFVRYNEVSLYRGSFFYIFYYCWGRENCSLYRGLCYIQIR